MWLPTWCLLPFQSLLTGLCPISGRLQETTRLALSELGGFPFGLGWDLPGWMEWERGFLGGGGTEVTFTVP